MLFFTSLSAFAAGGGHGGLGDLVAPGVNFAILLIFAIVKLKKPMSEHFQNWATQMKTEMDSAEAQSKEAKLKLEANQKKLDQLDSEIEKINQSNEDDMKKFEENFLASLDQKAKQNYADAQKRLELEKQVALNSLGEQVLSQIISQTKNNINGDSGNKTKAEQAIAGRL